MEAISLGQLYIIKKELKDNLLCNNCRLGLSIKIPNLQIPPDLAQLVEHLTVVVQQLWLSKGRWFDSSSPEYIHMYYI